MVKYVVVCMAEDNALANAVIDCAGDNLDDCVVPAVCGDEL
jgi:hypothetical protein